MKPGHRLQSDFARGRSRRRPRRLFALALAIVLLCAIGGITEASAPSEYAVKAAYLYNFGRFVQWPAEIAANNGSFTICVLGQDPFGRALNAAIAGQTIHGRRIVILRISAAQEAAGCQILFIDSSEKNSLQDILTALDDRSVLTVSDMPGFAERGGMIHFITEDNRIRFEVNLAAAKRAGLTLSSQLLKLAFKVREGMSGRPSKRDA